MFRKIIKKLIPTAIFRKIEPTGHLIESVLANIYYGFPGRKLNVIGVTGTNGKTTTSFMIYKMLLDAGYDVALMTTVASGVGSDIKPQTAHVTTLSAPKLQKSLCEFKKSGAKWVVLETTSHALAQHRIWGVPYRIAVMTNITHEHLDYHGSFEQYLRAKVRLFKLANRHPDGFGIVNSDDPNCDKFAKNIKKYTTYGIKSGNLQAKSLQLESNSSRYSVALDGKDVAITVNIPGEFNIANSLAAVAVGQHLGLSAKQIAEGIASLENVEGRMTTIDEGQGFGVVVDFAHTPDAFERLLSDARKRTAGKLVVLFGSAGRRDETKRAIQGEIAGKYADILVLTEEDDRDVDGQEILAQIAAGAKSSGKQILLELDRSKAIALAVSQASSPDDLVVMLGKGHEKTIERADGEHAWDEVAEVRKALGARLNN